MNIISRSFALAALFGALSSAAIAGHHETANAKKATIVDVAVSNGSFKTLVTALQAADLADALSGEGPFTVLAPTDEAFAQLPEGALEGLLADPAKLAEVLKLHVVSGSAKAADVVKLKAVPTLAGATLPVSTADGVTVGGAQVVATDIEASNGIIHVIDRVILPK